MTTQPIEIPEYIGDDRTDFRSDDVGFLLRLTNKRRGWQRWDIRPHPARTSGSFQPVLQGTVDGGDTTVDAVGVARVTEVARNGRAKVSILSGGELNKALHELGYPEMIQ